MDQLPMFILKSTIVSGILCGWYTLALKNKRLHNYNRFFLLFTLYASIQVPLLNFSWSPAYEKTPAVFTTANALLHTFNDADRAQPIAQQAATFHVNWQATVLAASVLISIGLLTTMVLRIAWIVRKAKKYPVIVRDGVTFIRTDLSKAPFSFMNRIYWRDSISMETEAGRLILRHELAHVKFKHSYDKLASQLLTCIFWMNPFYWIIQKELGMVHEFIADEHAIIEDNSKMPEADYTAAFAKMLLQVHSPINYLTPEHQFFSSPIKRRLIMLQTNKAIRASIVRRLAVLPLIAGSIFIFAFSPKQATSAARIKSDRKIVLVVDAGHGGDEDGCSAGSFVEKDINLKVATRIKELAPAYNIEVHLTRSADQHMTLEERVTFSNKLQPDDFISLHVGDERERKSEQGTFDIAIYDKNIKAKESRQLANAIYKHAARAEWAQKSVLSEKNPYVLRENKAASALIVMGDINSKMQMQYMNDHVKLDELCNRILQGVVEAHRL